MLRDAPFIDGEYYHVFNRGAHKIDIFLEEKDYERFQLLLHLANNRDGVNLRNIFIKYKGKPISAIFESEIPDKGLVEVLAYCLMPNHFHLVLRQKSENGISSFLKRLLTGYSMYFNLTNEHSGTLFQGPAKSRLVDNEAYFRYIFAYVHLNPLALIGYEKQKHSIEKTKMREFLNSYPYSSFYDYNVANRPEKTVLALDSVPDFLKASNDLEDLLRWEEGGDLLQELSTVAKDSPLHGGW